MSEWKLLSQEPAPVNVRILVWGGARTRFGVLDEVGNWRATHHGPIRIKSTHWMHEPEPPT